ncbi:hypothetical protein TNCV_3374101 [Trichonephila clavipes]|nr:hypothetical protein TNCV_3374101 [Trichonephila clavipes]
MSSHSSMPNSSESEDIERMDWPARSPDLNPIEHVWNFLVRRLGLTTTTGLASIGVKDEWAAMPQTSLHTVSRAWVLCETCLAERGFHTR